MMNSFPDLLIPILAHIELSLNIVERNWCYRNHYMMMIMLFYDSEFYNYYYRVEPTQREVFTIVFIFSILVYYYMILLYDAV